MKAIRSAAFLSLAILCNASARATTMPTVAIGNPGNTADTRYVAAGVGSVGYQYRIGKYEVTNAQYVEFLNGVDPSGRNMLALYDVLMTSDARGGINFNGNAPGGSRYEIKPGRDDKPVVVVSWYDAIRFANWMHNGMGSGDTENGAYTLLGRTPTPTNGNSITRNPGAKWWLPSDDEWYKAAYHKNDGVTGNYWNYPTSTDAIPYSDQPPGSDAPDPSNTANFFRNDFVANGYNDGYAVTGSERFIAQNYLTDVGAYVLSDSPYGTFDQGGNVWEWNETLNGVPARGQRGSSSAFDSPYLRASGHGGDGPTGQSFDVGFRVASIPEPASIALCVAGILLLTLKRELQQPI
jgi:formylglycine-generating enzyme